MKNFKKIINIVNKWYYAISDFLIDIYRFFKTIWLFRKDLYNYRWHSSHLAVFTFMKTALEDMSNKIESFEVNEKSSKFKQLEKMKRSIKLMKHFIDDDFINLAEKDLGYELDFIKPKFELHEDGLHYKLVNFEEISKHSVIFDRANEIEESMWSELFNILKGQSYSHYEVFLDKSKDKENAYYNWFDGSGLRNWWG